LLAGLWRFMAVYAPRWDRSLRTLVLGLVMCSACVRWGFKVGQPAALVVGLFAWFLAELKQQPRAWVLVLCAGLVGAVKVTFGMPFVIIAAAQRRYAVTVGLFALWPIN